MFILYELSTPFLNIHWFFDKLNMTGTKPQLYNGILLLFTFASCRLVYGTIQSIFVYIDMYRATQSSPDAGYLAASHGNSTLTDPNHNIMAFAIDAEPIPYWLAGIYVLSNVVLNSLNWHWFFKMIAAVRKRFEPPKAASAIKEKGDVHPTDLPVTTSEYKGAAASGRDQGSLLETRKRRSTLEDLSPDSEELREGTIQ